MASRERPESVLLGLLRPLALIAVLVGATGSLGLMLREGRKTPRFLLLLFVVWVLSPFVALAWANLVATRWSVVTRATLLFVTLVVALGSLTFYGKFVLPPAGSPNAFVFVAVPPISWVLIAVVVPMAALIARKASPRGAGG